MNLEVPNLFLILAFAFFFGPMFFLALYGCLASFWRIKRKKKERQHETFATEHDSCFGEYPYDNKCDYETCHEMCTEVMRCIMNTPQGDEE